MTVVPLDPESSSGQALAVIGLGSARVPSAPILGRDSADWRHGAVCQSGEAPRREPHRGIYACCNSHPLSHSVDDPSDGHRPHAAIAPDRHRCVCLCGSEVYVARGCLLDTEAIGTVVSDVEPGYSGDFQTFFTAPLAAVPEAFKAHRCRVPLLGIKLASITRACWWSGAITWVIAALLRATKSNGRPYHRANVRS